MSGGADMVDRRALMAGAAALALAPGVFLLPVGAAGEPASAARRWGLLINAEKCRQGCDACVKACAAENGVSGRGRPETDAQWIRKVALRDPATGWTGSPPMMCQHCAKPPCVDVCPTGASFRRADGVVLVDKHICIGCRYCMMACPYKARSFVHEEVSGQKAHAPRGKGTVESCTLCVHRLDGGREPACVEACQRDGGGAMLFGDLKDPDSAIAQAVALYPTAQVRADLRLDPAVRYMGI
jgi:molybdopterin-containing oxidoreductase family iron-sulfur binding subunit